MSVVWLNAGVRVRAKVSVPFEHGQETEELLASIGVSAVMPQAAHFGTADFEIKNLVSLGALSNRFSIELQIRKTTADWTTPRTESFCDGTDAQAIRGKADCSDNRAALV